jgi:hypothetical protein
MSHFISLLEAANTLAARHAWPESSQDPHEISMASYAATRNGPRSAQNVASRPKNSRETR